VNSLDCQQNVSELQLLISLVVIRDRQKQGLPLMETLLLETSRGLKMVYKSSLVKNSNYYGGMMNYARS
jgi:hypothetical protein